MNQRLGFTLLELLIVMAILGILMALGLNGYGRWRAVNKVLEGAQEFGQVVTTARAGAKRQNACWQVALSGTTDPTSGYMLKKYSTRSCTGTPASTTNYSLPAGTQLYKTRGTREMNFVPPYGTTDSSVNSYEVRWASKQDWKREVYVTGILGKVIIK